MAILNSIGKKSGLTIVVIGLALLAFLLTGLFKGKSGRGSQGKIGVINGETIYYNEFDPMVKNTAENLKQRGNTSYTDASNLAWDALIQNKIIETQTEELGISISSKEVWDKIMTGPYLKNNKDLLVNGVLDENKVKVYLATIKKNNPQMFARWVDFENNLKKSALSKSYFDVVKYGFATSDKEAEIQNQLKNNTVDIKFVKIPYNTADIKVSDEQINSYISKHEQLYKREASRDLQFVIFQSKPSEQDIDKVLKESTALLEDKIEYNSITKANETIPGLKNAKNIEDFVNSNSDKKYFGVYSSIDKFPVKVSEFLKTASVGETFGPVRNDYTYVLGKLLDKKNLPDSVKSSHILVSYKGLMTAKKGLERTKEEAKILSDSIYNAVKNNPKLFAELAKKYSADGSKDKGGDLGWATESTFVPEFRDFVFNNKKGDLDVIETRFGFHVIKINDNKSFSTKYKVAEIVRNIYPSNTTDNEIYARASKFFNENTTVEKFNASAAKNKYQIRRAESIKLMDSRIQGLGEKREIIKWAFNEKIKVGDRKIFNINNASVVVLLTGSANKGLASADEVRASVEGIVKNEISAKKIISEIGKVSDLNSVATKYKSTISTASGLNFSNPVIIGVGFEPKVVGKAFSLEKNKISAPIEGNNGVYVVVVTDKKDAPKLDNYLSQKNSIVDKLKNSSYGILKSIKESIEIKDNRNQIY